MGFDRPSADYANAKVIFLISSHLEAGHYFNPHAQRIMEGKQRGAKVICVDPRLSNTGAHADWWLPAWPGTEAAILLAIAQLLLEAGTLGPRVRAPLVQLGDVPRGRAPGRAVRLRRGSRPRCSSDYAEYTPEHAAHQCGVEADDASARSRA